MALTFLDDEEGEPETYPQPGEADPCFLAIVVGVGAKVTGVKKGDTVVVRSWARNAPCVGGARTSATRTTCSPRSSPTDRRELHTPGSRNPRGERHDRSSRQPGGPSCARHTCHQTHAAAPAAVPASDAAKPADPNWLNGRIAQAKTSATTELLSRLARAPSTKRRRPSRLLELRPKRRRPPSSGPSRLDGQLKNAAQQRDKLAGVIKARAELETQTLTPEQLAAVTGIAGEDPQSSCARSTC